MLLSWIRDFLRPLYGIAVAVCMMGCIDENPQTRDGDPFDPGPTGGKASPCQMLDGPADPCPVDSISARPCKAEEESCRPYRSQDSCSEPLFCRETVDCPAIAAACPPEHVPCNEANSPDCKELSVGTDPCVQTLWCREVSGCPDIPVECPAGMTFCTGNPGEEPDCQDVIVSEENCQEVIRCKPIDDCDPMTEECECDQEPFECPDDLEPCQPGESELCTGFNRGQGPCRQTFYCGPPDRCDEPVCAMDEIASDRACLDGEPDCRETLHCGDIKYCRLDQQCDAVPTCREDEVGSFEDPCEPGESNCRPSFECGGVIYCRPEPVCDAEPNCAPNEQESLEPCAMNEVDCRSETLCGATVYCRPVDEGLLALPDCDDVDLDVDPFTIANARIDGDVLRLDVTASGGCAEHRFMGCHRPVVPEEPIQFNVTIGHDSNDDVCEGIVMQEVSFDLTILRDIYLTFVNAQEGQVSLFISSYATPLVYRF